MLESWDIDSEAEREKAEKEKRTAEAEGKAKAEVLANKKSRTERIAERQADRVRANADADAKESEDETEAERRQRLRSTEKAADLRNAEDLFDSIGVSNSRKATTAASAVVLDQADPTNAINLSSLPLFNPTTKAQFEQLRGVLVPVLVSSVKKPHYVLFLQELTKQLAKELPSDHIKKLASSLTALGNEKMKDEKAAEKGPKKSRAAKTKTTLAGVVRGGVTTQDVNSYDKEEFGE